MIAFVLALGVAALDAGANGNARAEKIASESQPTKDAMASLNDAARAIKSPAIRAAVLDVLAHPQPTFLKDRGAARKALVDAGFVDASVTVDALFPSLDAPLSFAAASGGILGKHHGHPGGLAMHTVVNLRAARDLAAQYRARYGVELDEDIVIAAPILHDAMKAWSLQFNADGTLLTQPMIAGTSSHHPFIVAEALHRGLPDDLVVALAAAHEPPGMPSTSGADKVAAFIAAGALLARKETPTIRKEGGKWVLAKPARIEASINHLSDHDYVLADPAYALVDAALDRVVGNVAERTWRKHELLARVPGLTLYAALTKGGDEAVRAAIARP